MAEMQLYRVINPFFEKTDVLMDTSQRGLTPRLQKTMALAPIFDLITKFWENSGCQLTTAVQALTEWNLYCHVLEPAVNRGEELFSAQNINEQDLTIFKIKDILLYYYNYKTLGVFLDPYESWAIWEYLWEKGRQQYHSDCISRYDCMFAFATKQDADKYLQERQLEDKEHKTSAHLLDKICFMDVLRPMKLECFDMRWLDSLSTCCTYNLYEKTVNNYWSGRMTKNPLKEILYQGEYILRNI